MRSVNAPSAAPADVLAVVVAGGLARRMGGGDKALIDLAGRPLLARLLERLRPQAGRIVLNANGDPARFAAFGLETVPDPVPGRPGPLAGVLAGLEAVRPGEDAVLAVAADMPFLPPDLVARLAAALSSGAAVAMPEAGGRLQTLAGLWRPGLAGALRADLSAGRASSVRGWLEGRAVATVPFDPAGFADVDDPGDLSAARARIAGVSSG